MAFLFAALLLALLCSGTVVQGNVLKRNHVVALTPSVEHAPRPTTPLLPRRFMINPAADADAVAVSRPVARKLPRGKGN